MRVIVSVKVLRKTVLCLAAVSILGSSLAAAEQNLPTAFVGSFVSIKRLECESGEAIDEATGNTVVTICMDAIFQATYSVEKVLEGKLVTGSQISFRVADHYGFPEFAKQKRALLFLEEDSGMYYHIKYQWVPVFRTNAGEFAQCGCDGDDDDDDDGETPESTADCRTMTFSPAVTKDLAHASQYVIDELRAGSSYRVQENQAVCVRGVFVEDVYKRMRPGLLEDINDPQ